MPRASKTKAPPTHTGGVAELRHYTPEEVAALGLLPYTPKTLRKLAQQHKIPHSRAAAKITFRLCHIREIANRFDVRPIHETKPAA